MHIERKRKRDTEWERERDNTKEKLYSKINKEKKGFEWTKKI
jgi:hypothetical protein